MATLALRRPDFTGGQDWISSGFARGAREEGDRLDACDLRNWTPMAPELSAVANAVSLSMPYVEPYLAASVRATLKRLPPKVAAEAAQYCAQEASHQAQHRRYNAAVRQVVPGARFLESGLRRFYSLLGRRSTAFGVAYAAGFETVAYSVARWVDPRIERLFERADEGPTSLFLWHLAEEIEHKGVALDVHRAIGGRRRTYAGAMALSFAVLGIATVLGTFLGLVAQRRWWSPVAWIRLVLWSLSYLFVALPLLVMSISRQHDPMALVDPPTLPWWLKRYNPKTGQFPHWSEP